MANYILKTLKNQDRFTLCLSGGSTPKALHQLLAREPFLSKIPWQKLHIFWGDERFVPFADDRNNARMAFDTLLNFVPIPAEQIHLMQTENLSPEKSAEAYETLLQQYFQGKPYSFDLVLLGMGDDAHTLSLFPGEKVIHEKNKLADSLWLDNQNMYRVTLTAPIVNRAAEVAFLVTGNSKTSALKNVWLGPKDVTKFPAQIIQPKGNLQWWVDAAALGDIELAKLA